MQLLIHHNDNDDDNDRSSNIISKNLDLVKTYRVKLAYIRYQVIDCDNWKCTKDSSIKQNNITYVMFHFVMLPLGVTYPTMSWVDINTIYHCFCFFIYIK